MLARVTPWGRWSYPLDRNSSDSCGQGRVARWSTIGPCHLRNMFTQFMSPFLNCNKMKFGGLARFTYSASSHSAVDRI